MVVSQVKKTETEPLSNVNKETSKSSICQSFLAVVWCVFSRVVHVFVHQSVAGLVSCGGIRTRFGRTSSKSAKAFRLLSEVISHLSGANFAVNLG